MSLSIPYYALKVETYNKYTVIIIDVNSQKYWVERRFDDIDDAINHINSILVTDYEFVLYSPQCKYIDRYYN